uniref:B-cell receptor CD22 n=1 Tax=Hucho hucho TaxID=62062 RepID=A0A4W5NAP0_9TELE
VIPLCCVNVSVVLGQKDWGVTYTKKSICALKGSTVKLSCSYTYPRGRVTTTFWFTKNDAEGNPVRLSDDPDYKRRVKYSWDKKKGHTLTIRDLRESDSATYKFRFITDQTGGKYTGDPGVTLSLTGLLVKVIPAGKRRTLTCSTTCTLTDNPTPTNIWYKNRQPVKKDSSSMYSISSEDADSYSCTVKGREDLRSPAVYKPKSSVSVSPSGEIVEGSSVTLTCSSDANPPVDKYTWYFQNKTFPNGFGQMYNISNFKSKDNGHYHCEAWNGRGSRNSTALMIILPDLSCDCSCRNHSGCSGSHPLSLWTHVVQEEGLHIHL